MVQSGTWTMSVLNSGVYIFLIWSFYILFVTCKPMNSLEGSVNSLASNINHDVKEKLDEMGMKMRSSMSDIFSDPNFPGNNGWQEKMQEVTEPVPSYCNKTNPISGLKFPKVDSSHVILTSKNRVTELVSHDTYVCQDGHKPEYYALLTTVVSKDKTGFVVSHKSSARYYHKDDDEYVEIGHPASSM